MSLLLTHVVIAKGKVILRERRLPSYLVDTKVEALKQTNIEIAKPVASRLAVWHSTPGSWEQQQISNGRAACRCLCHSKPRSFEAANRMILGNMADLMVREIWGAYEHAHRQRILQLVRLLRTVKTPKALKVKVKKVKKVKKKKEKKEE